MWGTLPAFYLWKFVKFSNYPAGFKKFCVSFFCHSKKFPPLPLYSKIFGEVIINTMCDIAPQGKPHDFNLRKCCKKNNLCLAMPPLQCYCPAPLHYSNIKTPYYCNNKFKGILYFYLVIFLHSRLLIIFNRVVLIFPTLATPAILRFFGLFYTEDYSSMPPFCSILNTFTISPIKFPFYLIWEKSSNVSR